MLECGDAAGDGGGQCLCYRLDRRLSQGPALMSHQLTTTEIDSVIDTIIEMEKTKSSQVSSLYTER